MSEFYKQKRNKIIKDYKYLGIDQRIIFYFFRSCAVALIVSVMNSFISNEKYKHTGEGVKYVLIILLITVFTNYIYKMVDVMSKVIPENEISDNFIEAGFIDEKFFF